jgi:hypothetical protein
MYVQCCGCYIDSDVATYIYAIFVTIYLPMYLHSCVVKVVIAADADVVVIVVVTVILS